MTDKKVKRESTNKVAREVAEEEFERFVESMGIDDDPASMKAEDLEDFEALKGRIIRRIEKGSVIIHDNGEPEYIPQRTEDSPKLKFKEPTGATLMETDRKKTDIAKTTSLIAAMTEVSMATISKLKVLDYKACSDIATLFMGAE